MPVISFFYRITPLIAVLTVLTWLGGSVGPIPVALAQDRAVDREQAADQEQAGADENDADDPKAGVRRPMSPIPRTTPKPPTRTRPNRKSPTAKKAADKISLVFKDVDIRVLIQFISKLTGQNFIVSDKVTGRVTIISPKPVTKEEALRIFESVLEVNGFTTIEDGQVVKVVPVRDARRQGVAFVPPDRESRPGSEAMITQVINLNHAEAAQLRTILVPLASRHAYITAHSETNSLVITDAASNVRRLVKIVQTLDQPGSQNRVEVIPLKNAQAKDLAAALEKLFAKTTTTRKVKGSPLLGQDALKVLSDERTNSVILLGAQSDIDKAKEIVVELDVPEQEGAFNIHVIYLRYAVAEELAEVLGSLAGASASSFASTDSGTTKKNQPQKNKEEMVKTLSGTVKIVADKATNSLIVSASPQEFRVVEAIVKKLDIPRRLVYVEAVILEMSTEKSLEFGVNWSTGDEQFVTVGGNPAGINLSSPLPGLSFGFLGKTIELAGMVISDLNALVRAAQTDSDIRIVATPQILTTDNEEASVEVATNLPFLTRVDQGTDTDSRAVQVYDYRDVGYTLKVTPRISDNGVVRLALEVTAKAIIQAQTQDDQGNVLLAPTTNVRSAKSTILTRDSEIVAIGGLIGQEASTSGSKAPCLGDIPVLGWGFKSTQDKDKRTNLLIFLSPHVMTTEKQIRTLTEEKRKIGREAVPAPQDDMLTPFRPPSKMPDILKAPEKTNPAPEATTPETKTPEATKTETPKTDAPSSETPASTAPETPRKETPKPAAPEKTGS